MAEEKNKYLDTTGLQRLVGNVKKAVTDGSWTGMKVEKEEGGESYEKNYIFQTDSTKIIKGGKARGIMALGLDMYYQGSTSLLVGNIINIQCENPQKEINFRYNTSVGLEQHFTITENGKLENSLCTGYSIYPFIYGNVDSTNLFGSQIFFTSGKNSTTEASIIAGNYQAIKIPENANAAGICILGSGAYYTPNTAFAFGVGGFYIDQSKMDIWNGENLNEIIADDDKLNSN